MTSVISQAAASAEGAALSALFNAGTLTVRTGTRPGSPETAASGTQLFQFTLATPSMTWANGVGTLAGQPLSVNATAAGTPGWARYASSGNVGIIDCDVGVGSATLWAANNTYAAAGTVVTNANNALTYVLITTGTSAPSGTGPSGTGTGITDGSCVWNYLGAAVASGLNLQITSVSPGEQITLSGVTYTIPSA